VEAIINLLKIICDLDTHDFWWGEALNYNRYAHFVKYLF